VGFGSSDGQSESYHFGRRASTDNALVVTVLLLARCGLFPGFIRTMPNWITSAQAASFLPTIRKLLTLKGVCRTDPCLGLTPIAEQHPTTKTLEPSDTFCRLFTLAFATGSFPDSERKPSLIVIDYLMCRYGKFRPLASHGTP